MPIYGVFLILSSLLAVGCKRNISIDWPYSFNDSDTPRPVIAYFSSSSYEIKAGETAVLSWSVSNSTRVTLDPPKIIVVPIGTQTVSPTKETLYVLLANNSGGQSFAHLTIKVKSGQD